MSPIAEAATRRVRQDPSGLVRRRRPRPCLSTQTLARCSQRLRIRSWQRRLVGRRTAGPLLRRPRDRATRGASKGECDRVGFCGMDRWRRRPAARRSSASPRALRFGPPHRQCMHGLGDKRSRGVTERGSVDRSQNTDSGATPASPPPDTRKPPITRALTAGARGADRMVHAAGIDRVVDQAVEEAIVRALRSPAVIRAIERAIESGMSSGRSGEEIA